MSQIEDYCGFKFGNIVLNTPLMPQLDIFRNNVFWFEEFFLIFSVGVGLYTSCQFYSKLLKRRNENKFNEVPNDVKNCISLSWLKAQFNFSSESKKERKEAKN